jgi:YbbR domain-containing protein
LIAKKKISKTFLSFLLAAIFMWLLITLSKEYSTAISFPIKYTKIAQNKLLQATPVKTLEILVKTTGFSIFRTRFNTKEITINANTLLKKTGTKYYLLLKNQKQRIQKQLPSGVALEQLLKDTLFLDLGRLVTKKIPLKPNIKISYHVGYDLSEEIMIAPDSILVSGPENYMSALKGLALLPIVLEDVMANFTTKVAIKMPEGIKNLKLDTKEITVSGKVEKFTEGTLEVPYTVTNMPKDLTINTLTKKIQITFIIGLSRFNKINENSFQIECDYSISESNNLGYLIPKLVHIPSEIKSYKIIPNKIDFLIQN